MGGKNYEPLSLSTTKIKLCERTFNAVYWLADVDAFRFGELIIKGLSEPHDGWTWQFEQRLLKMNLEKGICGDDDLDTDFWPTPGGSIVRSNFKFEIGSRWCWSSVAFFFVFF